MKTKIKRHGRSILSVILALSMLVSCMMVGMIATDAAYDNNEEVGWNLPYMLDTFNGFTGSPAANKKMSQDGTNYSYTYYFKKTDSKFYFRFKADGQYLGAKGGANTQVNTSSKRATNDSSNNQNSFEFDPNWLVESGKTYPVKIRFYSQGAEADVWYQAETGKADLSGSLAASTYSTVTNSPITLTPSVSNNFGTLQYTYYVSTDNGSTWSRIGNANITTTYTYTPTSTGTYKFKVDVNDSAVQSNVNAPAARTATLTSSDVTVSAPSSYAVSVKINNSSYGTAVASSSSSGSPVITEGTQGNTVYIKATERAGELDTITAKRLDTGAAITVTIPSGQKYGSFTMPNSAVIVNVTFKEKTPENAQYYYNGYNNNGTSTVSGYANQQMYKGYAENGAEFAYYQVNGRTDNQIFTITDASSDVIIFEKNWDGWSENDVKAYFNNSGGTDFPGDSMSFLDTNSTGNKKRYVINVPSGATLTTFSSKENNERKQTKDIDLTSYTRCQAYYLSSWDSADNKANTTAYNSQAELYADTISGIFADGSRQMNSTYDIRHENQNSKKFAKPGVSSGTSGYYIIVYYPNTDYGEGIGNNNTDHPIVVANGSLPGPTVDTNSGVTIYAKDGTLTDTTRSGRADAATRTLAYIGTTKIDEIASDVIVTGTTTNYGGVTGQGYQTATGERGKRLRLTTTIDSNFNNDYYVKGWCINGKTYGFNEGPNEDSTDNVYVLDISIPYEKEIPEDKLEITPIYYRKSNANTVMLYVDGYNKDLQATGWSNTPYIYPFYGNNDNIQNAFGSYPGQPMVFDGGKYQMQIPIQANSPLSDQNDNASIRGITISNGYLDKFHADTFNITGHLQTYDYDDFYKIFNEKKPDNIRFTFKYRSTKNNKAAFNSSDTSNLTASNFATPTGNGWEDLENDMKDPCDLFGTPIEDSHKNDPPIHVVSTGYYDNAAGQYGTEWRVYDQDNKLITANSTRNTSSGSTETFTLKSIVPSALVLNSVKSFDKSEYADNGRGSYANGNATQIPQYKPMYEALEQFRGVPVLITYEENAQRKSGNWDYAKNANSADANRCDGRWTYSSDGMIIRSTIKVQFSNDNGSTWTDADYQNVGGKMRFVTSGTYPNIALNAYFTNTVDPNIYGKVDSGEQYSAKGKYFTFTAEGAGSYVFDHWYMEKTEQVAGYGSNGRTEMSTSDVIVARFIYVTSGYLRIGHNMKGTSTGTPQTKVEIYHHDNLSTPEETINFTSSDIDIPTKYISSNSPYMIKIYLDTRSGDLSRVNSTMYTVREFKGDSSEVASGSANFVALDLASPTLDGNYHASKTVTKDGSNMLAVTDLFTNTTQNVAKIIFFSELDAGTKATLTYNYQSRRLRNSDPVTKSYTVSTQYWDSNFPSTLGELTTKVIGNNDTYLKWIKDNAPAIEDFEKTCSWNFSTESNSSIAFDTTNKVITVTAVQTAKQYAYSINYNRDGGNHTTGTYVQKSVGSGVASNYFIANPTKFNDNSTNFSYWNVYPAIADVANVGELIKKPGSTPYARCYNRYFTLTLPEDSYIEAVYDEEVEDLVSIGEATYTREVFNAANGTTTDNLYADFIVNYMSANYEQLNTDPALSNYHTGLVLEINNKARVEDKASEADIEAVTFNSDNSEITRLLEHIVDQNATGTQTYDVTGEGAQDGERNAVFNYTINNAQYNKFNRLDFPLKFNNTTTWRTRVMKAYYYVVPIENGVKQWNKIKLSQPVYFCMGPIGNTDVDENGVVVITEN